MTSKYFIDKLFIYLLIVTVMTYLQFVKFFGSVGQFLKVFCTNWMWFSATNHNHGKNGSVKLRLDSVCQNCENTTKTVNITEAISVSRVCYIYSCERMNH